MYEKEIQISKKVEDIDRITQQFNTLARSLHLIPSTAKHAHGMNFQLSFSPHAVDQTIDTVKQKVKVEPLSIIIFFCFEIKFFSFYSLVWIN